MRAEPNELFGPEYGSLHLDPLASEEELSSGSSSSGGSGIEAGLDLRCVA